MKEVKDMLNGDIKELDEYIEWLCNSEEYVEYRQALESEERQYGNNIRRWTKCSNL